MGILRQESGMKHYFEHRLGDEDTYENSRYFRDCKQCLEKAGVQKISMETTPFYEGYAHRFQTTQYYKKQVYRNVPVRKNIGCDWPYAMRRYMVRA